MRQEKRRREVVHALAVCEEGREISFSHYRGAREDAQPILGFRLRETNSVSLRIGKHDEGTHHEYAISTFRSFATPGPLPAKKTLVGNVR